MIKTVTATTLSGVEIMEHWQNPATGELFSLAKLDLKAFEDLTQKSDELNENVKTTFATTLNASTTNSA